jgi:hypothetical protein
VTDTAWIHVFSYLLRKNRSSHSVNGSWTGGIRWSRIFLQKWKIGIFWLSWFDPGDPALGKRRKVVITFHPTTSKQYKLYRVLLYNVYIVFPIYGISTCVPGHINVRGKWFHLAQTSAKDARIGQLRPQDVSKHVPTCADIFTLWLGRLYYSKICCSGPSRARDSEEGIKEGKFIKEDFSMGIYNTKSVLLV